MNSPSHRASRRMTPSAWCMSAAALTFALLSGGCSTYGPAQVGGFTTLADQLPGALESGQGLCVGREGVTSRCVPGPKPKLVLDGLRVNLQQPIGGVLPGHVLCRVKREANQAALECVEIYARLPN